MPMHSVLHGPDLPNPWIPQGEPDQVAQTQQFRYQAPCSPKLNTAGQNTGQRVGSRSSLP